MRLLAVRLQNLNSLSGRSHEVRFDEGPLAQAGVFLITGPTGAGKSTLLDAITLALYGRAARYGNEKADEMMSRHTAECLAEVDFEAGGQQLRATWRLKRARGRTDGRLQPVERRLSRADTNEILAERGGDIDRMIERLTGLDCQRFLRSVLLAQGQFAAFLKAKPGERAELLEKITGTGIYSELSVLAFETHKEKQETATRLRDRLGSISVMADEERAAVEREIAEAQAANARVQAEHAEAAKRRNDLQVVQQQQREHAGVVAEIAKLHETRQSLAEQQTTGTGALTQAQAAAAAAAGARQAREPVWLQAEQLTARGQALETQLLESRAIFKQQQAAQKTALSLQAERQKSLARHDEDAAATAAWLKQNAEDADLADKAVSVRAALPPWRQAHQALENGRRLHGEKQALLKKQAAQVAGAAALAEQTRGVQEKLAEQRLELARYAASCEQQRKVVEQAQRVAGLEEHRQDLQPGEECPLCGATEHPFIAAAVSIATQLQSARQLLRSLEQQRDRWQRDTAAGEQAAARAETQLEAERKRGQELDAALREMQAPDEAALRELENAEAGLRLTLAPTPDEAEQAVAAMEQRARAYAANQAQANAQQVQRQKLEAELQLARQDADAKTQRLEELLAEGIKLKEQADAVRNELAGLLGGRSLEDDRGWHAREAAAAEQTLRQAEARMHDLQNRLTAANTALDAQERRRRELTAQMREQPPVTAEAVVEVETLLARLADQLAAGQRQVGSLLERLRNDEDLRRRREVGNREAKAAEAEATRWGRLKELIGSADGARFARFAQSLTLRQLTSLANHHLQGLTPRYRLMAVAGDELDLCIADLYQAGVERPMESLSGGESFLASLALALGLSELASRHHPIDSLFIDEGFGTLDGETLETAMAALENLRANGKNIGVISHVEAMKERITTQIRVSKMDGGCSRLEVVG